MRAQPMYWRGFLTDWVWPFAKTAVTAAVCASSPFWVIALPIALLWAIGLIFGLASIDDVLGLFLLIGSAVACVLAVLLAGMVCIGIPVTAYFVRRGGESKHAYKLAGALGGGAMPLLVTIALTDESGGVGLESAPVIAFAMFFCAAVGAITATLWWQNARKPHLETVGGFA